jgi:hypothetical protein
MMEEKLHEVVAILREHPPLSKLSEQDGYEVLAWAKPTLNGYIRRGSFPGYFAELGKWFRWPGVVAGLGRNSFTSWSPTVHADLPPQLPPNCLGRGGTGGDADGYRY